MKCFPLFFLIALLLACGCARSNVAVVSSCSDLFAATPDALEAEVFSKAPPFEALYPTDGYTKIVYRDGFLYALRKTGQLLRFSVNAPSESWQQVLDISELVASGGEGGEDGAFSFVFHPDFASNGFLYAVYNFIDLAGANVRLARFSSRDGGSSFDSDSAQVVLDTQRRRKGSLSHSGADLHFGPDGYLYVSFGDGSFASKQPSNMAQRMDTLLGKVLRIDIDRKGAQGENYAIPEDNPFAQEGEDLRPEIWALGLRNPFRFSFDDETGALWLGDVGQDTNEEINIIEKGLNYGWPIWEGRSCFQKGDARCANETFAEPQFAYGHDIGRAVLGGLVYRGDELKSLNASYIFSDFRAPYLWAIRSPYRDPTLERVLDNLPVIPISFATDDAGLLVAIGLDGTVLRFRESELSETRELPSKLSETGCMQILQPSEPKPIFAPYQVRSPLWSDGASKRRFVYTPAALRHNESGDLELPVGGLVLKEFSRDGVRLETRFLWRESSNRWRAVSYAWDPDQADATLAEEGTTIETIRGPWQVPSVGECFQCHTTAAGMSLGLELGQLRETGNGTLQIEKMIDAGLLFEDALNAPHHDLPRLDEENATLEDKARSYLHANCSSCHRPGGTGRGAFELSLGKNLVLSGLCDAVPTSDDFGVADPKIIDRENPDDSILLRRMSERGPRQMPPLGTSQVHDEAMNLIRSWISSIDCSPQEIAIP